MNIAAMTLVDRIISARAPPDSEKRDDVALVDGFLSRGAEECFEALVNRYKDKVFRLAASVMGPAFYPEAEDIIIGHDSMASLASISLPCAVGIAPGICNGSQAQHVP